jgi:hypothetical protein
MRLFYFALVALLVKLVSGGCDPFSQLTPIVIGGNPSCVGNTMTISADSTAAQVNVFTQGCAESFSTIAKGYPISAQASLGDYFEFSTWHEQTDVMCTLELGYDTGGGNYLYLLDYSVPDQFSIFNDPTLVITS